MSGAPMADLAKFAAMLARPEMERRSTWRVLLGWDHWAVILIRHARKGAPPERSRFGPAPRLRPGWGRETGAGLTSEELIYERIGQHLCGHVQEEAQVDVADAASIATTAVMATLAELGLNLPVATPEEADDA